MKNFEKRMWTQRAKRLYHRRYFQLHKEAYRISRMNWARKHPRKWLAIQRKCKYGVDYSTWLKMSKNGCMICKQKATHVDHNHKTDKVRGALCNNCNTGLGMFRDNQKLLQNAQMYLRKAK